MADINENKVKEIKKNNNVRCQVMSEVFVRCWSSYKKVQTWGAIIACGHNFKTNLPREFTLGCDMIIFIETICTLASS